MAMSVCSFFLMPCFYGVYFFLCLPLEKIFRPMPREQYIYVITAAVLFFSVCWRKSTNCLLSWLTLAMLSSSLQKIFTFFLRWASNSCRSWPEFWPLLAVTKLAWRRLMSVWKTLLLVFNISNSFCESVCCWRMILSFYFIFLTVLSNFSIFFLWAYITNKVSLPQPCMATSTITWCHSTHCNLTYCCDITNSIMMGWWVAQETKILWVTKVDGSTWWSY